MTADLSPEALAALDAKAAAATPGPWDWTITTDRHWSYVQADDGSGDLYTVAGAISDDDNAAFLAAADPSTVRALLAALTEARANIAHLRGMGREDTAWNEMKRQRDEARAEVERLTREQDTVTFLRAGSIIRERDAAEARLAAVRALHQPNSWADHLCECGQPEPCATARAMDGTP